jgi:hypothetical protein
MAKQTPYITVVRSKNSNDVWVSYPDGRLGRRFDLDGARRKLLEYGFTDVEAKALLDGAARVEFVVDDALIQETRVEDNAIRQQAELIEHARLRAHAFLLKEHLTNPANIGFSSLVHRVGSQIVVAKDAGFEVWDRSPVGYWEIMNGPHAEDAARHMTMLSLGPPVTIGDGRKRRRFYPIDLQRVWELARQFENRPSIMKTKHWGLPRVQRGSRRG